VVVRAIVSSPPPWINHPYTVLRALIFPTRLGIQILDTPTSRLIIVHRNNFLAEKVPLPKATSTGTTIVGCLFKDGIVLGADTRATEGDIVADKNCEKVQPLLLYHSCTDHWSSRSITSQNPFVAVVQEQPRTPNSLLPLSLQTWSSIAFLLAESLE
jgi:hypothetical protein